MALEDDDDAAETGAIKAAVRSAKKAARPAKIGEPERRQPSRKAEKKAKTKKIAKSTTKGGFDKDLSQKSSREGVRAKKGDKIGGMGKKGGKKKAK